MDSRRSKIFSIPFGNVSDVNDVTFGLIRESGFQGFLFSRGRLNFGDDRDAVSNIPCGERYMADQAYEGFQGKILKLAVKSVMHNFFSRNCSE